MTGTENMERRTLIYERKQNEKKSGGRVNTATKLINRVIRYMLHYYKYPFLLVIACILITAIATVVGATFPQTLVDDYITPMLQNGSDDFSGLASDLIRLACIMGVGVITAFSYNRIMVNVSQGTMRHLRDDLFRRMESLPIKYFDTHAHGDIMSVYTNDVDTLRQLLSQSIPQIINSVITMAATLITMIILNPALTVISILTAVSCFCHVEFLQTVREILYPPADRSGSRGRLYRGNAGRTESGQSLLP